MTFNAVTYRVLIASPSDLSEEREVATSAINDWNAQHSSAENIVLLPVKWETHARPQTGIRPQESINTQLVQSSDILIGLFWTKLGTSTGVAESGTVEEINQFVEANKPALLYFSSRPVSPSQIDIKQHQKLKKFKDATYRNALVGGFATLDELRTILLRDLVSQVRSMAPKAPFRKRTKIEEARELTEIIGMQKSMNITPEEFESYRRQIVGMNRTKAQTSDPVPPDEVGPNGHKIGYTPEGDKVEWIPDDENPDQLWPMILRRNDKALIAAINEFTDRIWYDRKLVLQANVKEGSETIDPEIEKGMLKAMRAVEKKYGGKRALRNYYKDDFEWGMLNGKLSALRWVFGDEWDMLDT